MKISVVIPVYNKEKYMDDLFQCLLSQTFEEFECILIDATTNLVLIKDLK